MAESHSLSAQEIPEAIQWHEGMLLAPQHFQQLASRHECLVRYQGLIIEPFLWGLRNLQIDLAMLLGGTLRVVTLEAIMPDGIIAFHDAQRGEELQVDLTPFIDEMKDAPMTVHLVVPSRRSGEFKGEAARYKSIEGSPVVDRVTGEKELRIPRLRPRLSLVLGETPPPKYVSFPLAKLQYRSETFSLTDFIAPTLQVPVKSPLGQMCALLAKRLREKALFLADQVRSPAALTGEWMVLETRSKIHSLVAGLPYFEAVYSSGQAHPYILYLALCGLVGHLAALGTGRVPPVLEPYDHNDLRNTFERARNYAEKMVLEGVVEMYTAVPFVFGEGIYSVKFRAEWLSRRLLIAVRGQAGMTEREVRDWTSECLIGSKGLMRSMRERRILGAGRQWVERDEGLVPPRGVLLFQLQADPQCIQADEELQIFNAGERSGGLRPAEILLYVRNPDE